MNKLIRGYKNNEKILNLIEQMFIYGAFSKKDVMTIFDESKSNSEKRLLDIIKNFGENHINTLTETDGKYYYASYSYFRDLYNYLIKIFYLKTTTPGRLKGYFLILQALNQNNPLSVQEILDEIAEIGFLFNDSFIRDLLNDMVEHGIILKFKESYKHTYTLAPDTLSNLTDEECKALHEALVFFSNTTYPYAIGDLTKKNVEMYIREYRKIDFKDTDFLHVINKGFHLALYEELIIDLLPFIREQKSIKVFWGKSSVNFVPRVFHLDTDQNELYLMGTVKGQSGYIKAYEIIHGKIPRFTLSQNPSEACVFLELRVNFNSEEYQIFKLVSLYPKSKVKITNTSVILDLSEYSETKQIELVLEQLPRLRKLVCNDSLRRKIVASIKKGIINHENVQ